MGNTQSSQRYVPEKLAFRKIERPSVPFAETDAVTCLDTGHADVTGQDATVQANLLANAATGSLTSI